MDLVLELRGRDGRPLPLDEGLAALGLPAAPPVNGRRQGSSLDEAPASVEVGRAETGATVLLEIDRPPAVLTRVRAPVLRAPWLVDDALVPAVIALRAAGATVRPLSPSQAAEGHELDEEGVRGLWEAERSRALRELALVCEQTGAPLPPRLPAADLAALRSWLLVAAEAARERPPAALPLLCLDARAGDPPRCAAALPARGTVRVPPGFDLLWTRGGDTVVVGAAALADRPRDERGLITLHLDAERAILDAASAEPLAGFRALAPVEVLDEESLRGISTP